MEVTPSQTLYVNNLNEKIKKDVLKKTLYMLFRQYGKIIDVIACKGISKRGQAFVVFEDVASSTNAMRSKQGFNFFDKPMVSFQTYSELFYYGFYEGCIFPL
jgi:U2 small nuclear ribonucleoprotein B''